MSANPVLQSGSAPLFTAVPRDDAPTLIAIAMLAFIATDVAHETIGHGAAFIALGGRSMVLTTMRLIHTHMLCESGGRIFSAGGPLGNLVCAAVAWLAQRALRGTHVRARVFLWLTMAFNLFWGTGYLI